MPKKVPPLTDARCRAAKPQPSRTIKLFDGSGLILEIRPSGAKLWRLRYRFAGAEKQLALGRYPDRPLAEARKSAEYERRLLLDGIDPSQKRKAENQLRQLSTANTLEAIAIERHSKFSDDWVQSHSEKVLLRLTNHVFPWIGSRPIASIEASELLVVLQRMERLGILDTARRVHQYLAAVYRYAIVTGRAKRNVPLDLKGAIRAPVSNHYATTTDPTRISRLLLAMDSYEGSLFTKTALGLAPLLFCRPGELRGMRWEELDLTKSIWTIPPARQKARKATKQSNKTRDHVVPLSKQALDLLKEIQPLTGIGEFVFPCERTKQRSMSNGTVNAAIRRLGFGKDEITGHGFRHMASTILNEQGWSPDAIERQLAHKDRDPIRGTYNHAEYMPERRRMMQAWADYLDRLRADRFTVTF